jgi:transposase-like protein
LGKVLSDSRERNFPNLVHIKNVIRLNPFKQRTGNAMNLTDPRFADANKAREYLEAQRWPHGPICPHCGNVDRDKITGLKGKSHRPGLYQCAECREQFTVMVGSVMERSKIPLHKWLAAIHMLGASKKGVSAHQIHRTLGITYQSAWFMCHRIREAMREEGLDPLGGGGKTVEADETYFGKQGAPKPSKQRRGRPYIHRGGGPAGKRAILALVERGGSVRSFHIASADKANVSTIVADNVARESYLYTDESRLYGDADQHFAEHATVHHSGGEYVRGEVHTNTVENVFSVFKRGMRGIYQHCGEAHLHRYLAEFDFRYNRRSALGVSDTERSAAIIRGMEGKRLTYKAVKGASASVATRGQ